MSAEDVAAEGRAESDWERLEQRYSEALARIEELEREADAFVSRIDEIENRPNEHQAENERLRGALLKSRNYAQSAAHIANAALAEDGIRTSKEDSEL